MKPVILLMQDTYLHQKPAGAYFIMNCTTDHLPFSVLPFIFLIKKLLYTRLAMHFSLWNMQRTPHLLHGLKKMHVTHLQEKSYTIIFLNTSHGIQLYRNGNIGNVIGRLYQVNPTEGERFYLRLLLHHILGCKSFEDLRTLDNGTICISFKEAALKRGFIQDDHEWIDCLQEATYTATPSQLRSLFITILIFCEPANHLLLWEKFNTHMSEDFLYQAKDIPDHFKKEYVTNLLLYSLDEQLHHHGKSLQDFPGIPQPSHTSTLSCHVQFNFDEQLQLAKKKRVTFKQRPNFCLQHHN